MIRPSYWTERRNNYTNYGSLLLANSVTGAASLFRRDLLDAALPFPPRLARAFHDHWLAVVAMSLGEITYVDEPLYDYVQHGDAVIGHSEANKRPRSVRTHLMERLRNPTGGSRVVYYYDWHQELLYLEVLRAALLAAHDLGEAQDAPAVALGRQRSWRASPGSSGGAPAGSGGTTRPSTASCSTPTHWSGAGPCPHGTPDEGAPTGCSRATPRSRRIPAARNSLSRWTTPASTS